MKKKILFVIDSLHCAGAEKSLITLLNLLDYDKYEVDLQLFGYGGSFEKLLPMEVKLLPPLEYTTFSQLSLYEAVKTYKIKMLLARLSYSFKIRRKSSGNRVKARYFWQSISKVIEPNSQKYDIAIAYAQGVPTFYVIDKIQANKKFAWVNTSYRLKGREREFQNDFYEAYNKIIAVSDSAKKVFCDVYPFYQNKINVIYDINDNNFIKRLSLIGNTYDDDFSGIRILTIGRLVYEKGYDFALDACRTLKKHGLNFRWYILGCGPLEQEILDKIKLYQIENEFILLGTTDNPYSYIKDCHIYVQPSRFEGFGLAIAEARMLNKPVVATKFDSVYNQMIDEKNGLVVDMNGVAVAEGILRLVNDKKLTNDIISYLENEKKGNIEELEKFYELITSEG